MSDAQSKASFDLKSGRPVSITGLTSVNGTQLLKIKYGRNSGYVRRTDFVMLDRAQVRRNLVGSGVVFTSNNDWNETVGGIEAVTAFPPKPLIDHPGWSGSYYAEATGFVHSPTGIKRGRAIFAPRSAANDNVAGTHEQWLDQIAAPLAGQHLPMLFVLAALASPVLRFRELHNFGFELWGPPAKGKTTLLALMASTAGPPTAIETFNSTQAGRERLFHEFQDRPFPIDEANLIQGTERQAMREFAFRMANGTVKTTAFSTQDRALFRFIFATSANCPFHEVVGEIGSATSAAALQRLFPLRVSDGDLGVFDFLPAAFATSGELAAHLSTAMRSQHGTPFRLFLQHLVQARHNDGPAFDDRIKRKIDDFARHAGLGGTIVGSTRATNAFGLLYAVGCFAKAKGVLPASWDCLAACLACYRNYQAQLPGQTPLAARLATIVARPDTLDLRVTGMRRLTDRRFQRYGAFLNMGQKGRTELLMTREARRQWFPDWQALVPTSDFAALNLGKGKRKEVQRRVRTGKGKEWFACFQVPAEITPPQ